MDVLIGATKSKLQWKCPKCKWNTMVSTLDFYMASLHVSTIDCHHCKEKFHVDVTLLDPRAATLRTPVRAEQNETYVNGLDPDEKWIDDKPVMITVKPSRSNRSAGG